MKSKSASFNRCSEYVCIFSVIIAEFEFRDVEREVLLADLVEGSDHAAFQDRPEAFDGLSVNRTYNVLAASMVNGGVRVAFIEAAVEALN